MRKLSTLLMLLLVAVGVSAQSWTIDVDADNGIYYRRDGSVAADNQWAATFKSNVEGAPQVTITNYDNEAGQAGHKFAATSNAAKRKSFSSGKDITWTISVEDGYVITGYTIVGSSNGNTMTLTPEKGGSATQFANGTVSTLAVEGLAVQSTTFHVSNTDDNGLGYSKYQVKVAKAYEVIVSQTTGSLINKQSGAAASWNYKWTSTQADPQVTVEASANNMQPNGSENIDYRSGSAQTSTYTVSCSDGYIIVAGSFTGAALTSDQTVTVEGNSKVFTTTTETFDFPVDSRAKSFGFVLSGPNTGLAGTMKVIMMKPSTTNVTYNLYYNGDLKGSETVASDLGFEPLIPDGLKAAAPFMNYSYDVDEITAATTEVNVTATWNGPFEYGSTLEASHWYFVKMKSSYNLAYIADGADNVQLPTSRDNSYKYQWAFVGDPFTGFTIYNREAGADLVFGSATHDPNVDSGASTHVNMKAPGTQQEELWTVVESSYATGGFFLKNSAGQALNQRTTTSVAYWTGGADAGSTFTVTDAENFYEQVASEIIPFFQDPSTVNTNFNISSDGAALMQNKLVEVTMNEFCSQADYETLKQQLEDNIVYPETGYFRIKSSGSRGRESYIGYGEFSQWGASYKGLCTRDVSVKETDLSTVILLTKQANKGVYKMSIQGLNVQNQTTNNQCFPLTAAEGADFTFRIYQPGVVAITSDFTDQGHLHEGNFGPSDGGAVVRWTFSSDASHWTIEPADVATLTLNEVDGKSYGTTYLPFNAYFLSGVKAYAVKVDGNNAKFTEVANNEFPAGTGVLLISDEGNTSVSVHPTTSGVAAVTDNDLTGHYLAGNVSDALVLNKNGENVVGFYMLNSGSSLAANRAYLPASALGTGVRALTLVEGTTGIDAALVNGNASQVYDLQGRRVMNAQKGLYIVNGKKTLVK